MRYTYNVCYNIKLETFLDQRTEECYSTKESLSDSINILSAEIQDLRRFAASHSGSYMNVTQKCEP